MLGSDKIRDEDELIAFCRAEFGNMWARNDPAHQEGHFREVWDNFKLIADRAGGFKPDRYRMGLLAAYTHDMFRWSSVPKHHELSYLWWRDQYNKTAISLLPRGQRLMVSRACMEHRASYLGKYSCRFTEAFAAADRGLPDVAQIPAMVERARTYQIAVKGTSEENALLMAVTHIREKFGVEGYAKYPPLLQKLFPDELREFREACSNVGESR